MKEKLIINTIDLWTERYKNHYECFNGAFVDGFENNKVPFDEYKIVKNCNCKITTNSENINISNKHNAIVFYKNNKPTRLMVINQDTEIENCIKIALNQYFVNNRLRDLYDKLNIKSSIVDKKEEPIYNGAHRKNEIDVGSCDRWKLLYNMLRGSYTENDTAYGNFESDKYEFVPDLYIKYELDTNTEKFVIDHKCAFINTTNTRLIPIQENSLLTGLNKIKKSKSNIFVLHSLNGDTINIWGQDIKENFNKQDIEVILPQFPIRENSTYEKFKEILVEYLDTDFLNENSIVICHSIGNAYFIRFCKEMNYIPKAYIAVAPGAVYKIPSNRNDYTVKVKQQAYCRQEQLDFMKDKVYNKYCLYSNENETKEEMFKRFIKDTNSKGMYLKYYNHFDGYHRIYKIPELIQLINNILKDESEEN